MPFFWACAAERENISVTSNGMLECISLRDSLMLTLKPSAESAQYSSLRMDRPRAKACRGEGARASERRQGHAWDHPTVCPFAFNFNPRGRLPDDQVRVCCSVLWCAAVCRSVLLCLAVCCCWVQWLHVVASQKDLSATITHQALP